MSIRDLPATWRIAPIYGIKDGLCACDDDMCYQRTQAGKHPRISDWHDDAHSLRSNSNIFEHWALTHRGNWILACGAGSGVVVVDIDPRNNGDVTFGDWLDEQDADTRDAFQTTLQSRTGGGGTHYFFEYSNDAPVKVPDVLPGVDFQGEGSGAILPPSKHVSGGVYKWVEAKPDFELNKLPEAFIALLKAKKKSKATVSAGTDFSETLKGVPEGSRNDTLFRYACHLRRKLADNRAEVSALVAVAGKASGLTDAEIDAIIDSAFKQDHTALPTSFEQVIVTEQVERVVTMPAFDTTDVFNRDVFTAVKGDDLIYVDQQGWYEWAGTQWVKISTEKVVGYAEIVAREIIKYADKANDLEQQKLIRAQAKRASSTAGLKNIVELSKSALLKSANVFDFDPNFLPCKNGMVDLRTGAIRAFDKTKDYHNRNTNLVFDPDADYSRWSRFLEQATDNDDALMGFLQEASGYSLTGLTTEQSIFVLAGKKASGKSTFISALQRVLGVDNGFGVVTDSETFTLKRDDVAPERALTSWVTARGVFASEFNKNVKFNNAFLKRISGEGVLSARFLRHEVFNFHPRFKVWLVTNVLPGSDDDAVFRRLKIVRFDNTVPADRQDRGLGDFLRSEAGAEGVLAWCVQGAKRFYANNSRVSVPAVVSALTGEAYRVNDRLGSFLKSKPEWKITPHARLFRAYKAWVFEELGESVADSYSGFVGELRNRG